ncbi:hypothetical protein M1D97_10480 [Kushneria sp. AK178]
MTRKEAASIAAGIGFVVLWLVAIAMGAAAKFRAQHQSCIKTGKSTLHCSQGYEPDREDGHE